MCHNRHDPSQANEKLDQLAFGNHTGRTMKEKIQCPYCGEMNAMGSNICGGCMKDIRRLANPDREDLEQTAKTRNPILDRSLRRRLRRWWERRRRRAT